MPSGYYNRKPVLGVGVNDVPGSKGDPLYILWISMLQRCYSDSYQARQPTYKGCSVCEDWLTFSNFKEWCEKNSWEGKELDKDLSEYGNKLYSPDTCVFLPREINAVFKSRKERPGLPIGVYSKDMKRFYASAMEFGIQKRLGIFDSPEEAHHAYLSNRAKYISELSLLADSDRVKSLLLKRSEFIERSISEGKILPSI